MFLELFTAINRASITVQPVTMNVIYYFNYANNNYSKIVISYHNLDIQFYTIITV